MATSPKSCPICDKPSSPGYEPFCSERCRTVDLNRWLQGSYVIGGNAETDDTVPNGDAHESVAVDVGAIRH